MKILIVGGGVAGPTLAAALKDRPDISITLIDKAPEWKDIGYAISLWGNGRAILRELGIEHSMLEEGYEIPWTAVEEWNGKILSYGFFDVFNKYGSTLAVSRTLLHKTLINATGNNTDVRLGMTISEIKQDEERATVRFSDGTQDVFDLVVGADGIRSAVREMVFGKQFLHYYNWRVWATWTPKGLGFPRGAIEAVGAGKVYFEYPMEDRAVLMFAASLKPGTDDPPANRKNRVRSLFGGFHPSILASIDIIPDETPIFADDLAHVDMQDWYKGRVVLTGDAQHATTPLTGMGASLALEDAFVLARELKGTSDISVALARYSELRHKRIKDFRAVSKNIERWLMITSPIKAAIRDVLLRFVPWQYFAGELEKILKQKI